MIKASGGRSATLDILRGLSALCIVLFHYTVRYDQEPYSDGLHYDLALRLDCGYAAVVTFFMMSGYWGAAMLRSVAPTPGAYLKKRLRRLYPAYWICVAITAVALFFLFPEETISPLQFIANLTMVSRLFGVPFVDGVYWSMQCELLFSLILVIFMLLRSEEKVNRGILLWLLAVIALNLFPVKALKFLGIITISAYAQCFAAGIVLFRLRAGTMKPGFALAAIALCAANIVVCYGALDYHMAFFIGSLLIIMLADKMDRFIPADMPVVRLLAWIAAVSYPLYLVHQMLGFALLRQMRIADVNPYLAVCITITVAFIIAWLVTRITRRAS